MLARVRKNKGKGIIILNYSNFKLNESLPWIYDEVKQGLILSNELILDRSSNKYSLSLYQEIYTYNRLEELNKQKYYFLDIFKRLAITKGFAIEIEERGTKKNNKSVTDSVITSDCEGESISDHGSSSTNLSQGVINEHVGNADRIY